MGTFTGLKSTFAFEGVTPLADDEMEEVDVADLLNRIAVLESSLNAIVMAHNGLCKVVRDFLTDDETQADDAPSIKMHLAASGEVTRGQDV